MYQVMMHECAVQDNISVQVNLQRHTFYKCENREIPKIIMLKVITFPGFQ